MVIQDKLMVYFRLESMQMKQEEELVSALATQNLQIEVNHYSSKNVCVLWTLQRYFFHFRKLLVQQKYEANPYDGKGVFHRVSQLSFIIKWIKIDYD